MIHPSSRMKQEEELPELFQRYEFGRILGKGNFAVVKEAVDKTTGKKYAVKIIDKKKILLQPILKEAFEREVEILKAVKHVRTPASLLIFLTLDSPFSPLFQPAIISFNDYHDDEQNIYIFLDL